MIKIGLTGGIGSGKSTVAKLLQQHGILVIDADQIAHDLLKSDGAAYQMVRAMFGVEIVTATGEIDRHTLGRIIFADIGARRALEEVMHPLIKERIQVKLTEHEARGVKMIVVEAPLLYEARLQQLFDQVWVVNIDDTKQLQRLQARDGLSEIELKQRINSQWPLEMKVKKADVVLQNNGNLAELSAQVELLLTKYA